MGSIKKDKKNKSPINIVLDLDNTLIYSFEAHEKIPKFILDKKVRTHKLKNDKGDVEFLVSERPYLKIFLTWLFKYFTVSVWSAGSPDYVKFIVKHCLQTGKREIKNVYDSISCEKSTKKYNSIKDLRFLFSKRGLNYKATNTIIIDDLPEVAKTNPDNIINIKKYTAKSSEIGDHELLRVREYLKQIRKDYNETGKINL